VHKSYLYIFQSWTLKYPDILEGLSLFSQPDCSDNPVTDFEKLPGGNIIVSWSPYGVLNPNVQLDFSECEKIAFIGFSLDFRIVSYSD
jgi:hypothetical protein